MYMYVCIYMYMTSSDTCLCQFGHSPNRGVVAFLFVRLLDECRNLFVGSGAKAHLCLLPSFFHPSTHQRLVESPTPLLILDRCFLQNPSKKQTQTWFRLCFSSTQRNIAHPFRFRDNIVGVALGALQAIRGTSARYMAWNCRWRGKGTRCQDDGATIPNHPRSSRLKFLHFSPFPLPLTAHCAVIFEGSPKCSRESS